MGNSTDIQPTVQSAAYVSKASDSGQDTAGAGTGVLASINTGGGAEHNTAMGWSALTAATTAVGNTAVGWNAGAAITTGQENTLLGRYAGQSITTAASIVALGTGAAKTATINGAITAVGTDALEWLTTGASATAVGYKALQNVTTGSRNTGVGYAAGYGNLTNATVIGNDNTFVGYNAGPNDTTDPSGSTAVGSGAVVTGGNSTAIGFGAQALAAGAVAIGVDSGGLGASTSQSNLIQLGTINQSVNIPVVLTVGTPGSTNGLIQIKGSATTGSAFLEFLHDSTIDWRIYHPQGDPNLYIRDVVNGQFGAYFVPGATTAARTFQLTSALKMQNGVYAGGTDVGGVVSYGTGAPNNANGNNGDIYFRVDGTHAGVTVIYHKESGAWVGCA